MHHLTLTTEERNILIAVIDLAMKSGGAQLLRENAGSLLQSVFTKLDQSKMAEPNG